MIAKSQARINYLTIARYATGVLGEEDYLLARLALDRPIEDAQTEIDYTERRLLRSGQPEIAAAEMSWKSEDPFRLWEVLEPSERRNLVNGLITRVLVNPAKHRGGNQFDPSRIEIDWGDCDFEDQLASVEELWNMETFGH